MKMISNWGDLGQFGIDCLTGEACTLGYRLLCDVTEKVKRLLATMLGGVELHTPENWNSGSAADPHVGSVMLSPEMFTPIAVFGLLADPMNAEVWILSAGPVIGFTAEDLELEARQEYWENHSDQIKRKFKNVSHNRTYRERHAMSGRVL